MHFGLYLKHRGIISSEQLVAACETQLHSLTRIGQLALEEGLLTPRGVFDVLRAQSESPHKRFGEVAIELGLMSRDELLKLLVIQADRRPQIADVLVHQGVLTEDQMRHELTAFRDLRSKQRAASLIHSKISPALWQRGKVQETDDVAAAV